MMKIKLLTLTAIVTGFLTIGSAANAATCEGGSLITGNNGHEYCQSNREMNWWSAYTWCETQGRHLATIYEICPDWDGSTGEGKCANVSGSFATWFWSSTASQANNAFLATQKMGVWGDAQRTSTRRALCY